MDDPLLVRFRERLGDLTRDHDRLVDGDRSALDSIGERPAFDELEHQELRRTRSVEAVDRRDVRMIQCCEYLRLALEARDAIGILRDTVRQDLQRDVATELRIARAIHLAHPAGAERRDDFVGTEASSGG